MPGHAGEPARESGTFHCAECGEKHYVKKGDPLPECGCGSGVYDRRTDEPANDG